MERDGGGTVAGGAAYLLLDVAGTPCALPRAAVAEVLPLPSLHPPPASGGWLAGFLDLGGTPVPVIDLAALLGLRPAAEPGLYAHLVLGAGRDLAYLLDRVDDLVSVSAPDLRPVSEGASLNGCVAAEIARGGRLVHVLDPDCLLASSERARVAALSRAAAARLAAFPESALADSPLAEPA